jgi:hypothetical protein
MLSREHLDDAKMRSVDKQLAKVSVESSDCNTYEFQCQQEEELEKQVLERKKLLSNQESIQKTLDLMITTLNTMNGTVNRNFDLYTDINKKVDELEVFMIERKALNGNADKDMNKVEGEIKDINDKRLPIYDRLTRLESEKANNTDVADIRSDIREVKVMLTEHCKMDEDDEKKRDKKYEEKRDNKLKIIGYSFTAIAIIVSIVSVLISKRVL